MAGGAKPLTDRVDVLRRQVEQVQALRQEASNFARHLERLERVLDFERVGRHAEAAVMAGELTNAPEPRLHVPDLLPHDAFLAVREAIPAEVFLEPARHGLTVVRVPPRAMPARVIVTWTFITELVLDVVSAALLARLGDPVGALARDRFPHLPPFDQWGVDVTLSRGRLVRRMPGTQEPDHASAPDGWDLITAAFDVSDPSSATAANTLIAVVGPSVPPDGPIGSAAERWLYEFGVGPTQQGRRRLARMTSAQPAS